MNRKLTYEEPIRFAEKSGQQKADQHFDMTCSCGANFPVPLDILGSSATCPKCGKAVKISDEEFMPITCGCGKTLRVPRQTAGAGKTCPSCKKPIKLLLMPSAQVDSGKTETVSPPPVQAAEKPANTCIKVRCSCGNKLSVPVSVAHQPVECPQCHKNIRVPDKYFIRINCQCGKELRVLHMLAGTDYKCPNCGKQPEVLKILKPAG